MNVVKKPDLEHLDKAVNPFSFSLVIPIKSRVDVHSYTIEDETVIHKTYLFEDTPKTSVYVKAEHRKLINPLSSSAKELLLWLFYTIIPNKSYIWINKSRYMEECSVSLNTYKKALDELVRYSLITHANIRDTYWINPEFFYKGDRKKEFSKNIIEIENKEEIVFEEVALIKESNKSLQVLKDLKNKIKSNRDGEI